MIAVSAREASLQITVATCPSSRCALTTFSGLNQTATKRAPAAMNALTAENPSPAVPPMTTILLPASATGATLVFIDVHFRGESFGVKSNQRRRQKR